MDKIDIVITWVDGNDLEWQKQKAVYSGKTLGDSRVARYRDWDTLKYLFRGIEKFAPWVNNVFLVTWGHLPNWINPNAENLRIVNHKDYIPQKYLPTFSSRTIDMNFHRIKELSEHFVYFNDDMFLIAPVKADDFFHNGLPRDTAILNAHCPGYGDSKTGKSIASNLSYTAPMFDLAPINRHFKKNLCIKKNIRKWISPKYGKDLIRTFLLMPWSLFPGFMDYHLPYSYLKSTFKEVWEKEYEVLDLACTHRFRTNTDVNHWVFTYWQLAKGNFYPRNPSIGRSFWLSDDQRKNEIIYDTVCNQKYKIVCINDSPNIEDFDKIKLDLIKSFEKILPEKSKYEI